ncbi:MAG: DUF3786 domain-containing protein [Deltaproteobacteria bacterium]|nr:DUF3786 domain-containing protein [Deltaproteobacteria bacterium]
MGHTAYQQIIRINLDALFSKPLEERARAAGGEAVDEGMTLRAFGRACRITREGVLLDGEAQAGPPGVVISRYALLAADEPLVFEPYTAFREIPDSMPYTGAFATHAEAILAPYTEEVEKQAEAIREVLGAAGDPGLETGDFCLVLRPLPKIALAYILYHADEDFPAGVTCLFSKNAPAHATPDILADVGEFTSRRILEILGKD